MPAPPEILDLLERFDLHREAYLSSRYNEISKTHQNVTGDFLYRLSHPLGEWPSIRASRPRRPWRR